jgi:NADPH:quinone reductase-like Zn-dependent oxidoreductase
MRALTLRSTGALPRLEEVAEPPTDAPGAHGSVLAASINPSDILRSQITVTHANAVIGATTLPRTVGTEAVLRLDTGERVYVERALVPYGTIADRAVGQPDQLYELPGDVSDEQAVCLGIAGLAGWVPVATLADADGASVLVLGATGAAGQVAVQAARILGARRIVVAGRRAPALARLLAYGADETIGLTGDADEDAAAFRAVAGPAGFDVIVDYLFGPVLQSALPTIASLGRVVVVGMACGAHVTLDGGDLLVRGAQILPYSNVLTSKDVRSRYYYDMLRHAAAGMLTVDVARYDLDQSEQAWERQASGAPGAKLVIVP